MGLALFRRFPELERTLPRLPLGVFPTRVHRLDHLARALGIGELWIKRDDRSGPRYGGNKVRKLEFLLGDAHRLGRQRIATIGGIGSNHVLATAIYARDHDMDVDAAVVMHPVNAGAVRTIRAALTCGVRYHVAPSYAMVAPALVRAMLADPRHRAYVVPAGGSSPLGTVGYVDAGLELAEQIASGECPRPDAIVVALGSGGTVAGLVVGLRLSGLDTPVLAVRVTSRILVSDGHVARLAVRTARLLAARGARLERPRDPMRHVELSSSELGRGYAIATPRAHRAVEQAAELEGLALETTYTGKAMAGLITLAPRFRRSRVLFWNTYNSVDIGPLAEACPRNVRAPRAIARVLETAAV